jgi:hypothetical protein
MRFTDKDLRARFPESFGYLSSVRKRAVRIEASAAQDASIAIGASRLGGAPDLPATVSWPTSNDRSLPFVAQIKLEDVAEHDDDALLPHEGWLLFFVDGERRVARVVRVDAGATLKRVRPPEDAIVYTPCAVGLAPIDLFPVPPTPFIDVDAIDRRERDDYEQLLRDVRRDAPQGKDHHLLGYPRIGEVPNADGDTRLLAQFDADPTPGFSWSGAVMLLANDGDLRRGDVDRVRVV